MTCAGADRALAYGGKFILASIAIPVDQHAFEDFYRD